MPLALKPSPYANGDPVKSTNGSNCPSPVAFAGMRHSVGLRESVMKASPLSAMTTSLRKVASWPSPLVNFPRSAPDSAS